MEDFSGAAALDVLARLLSAATHIWQSAAAAQVISCPLCFDTTWHPGSHLGQDRPAGGLGDRRRPPGDYKSTIGDV